MISAFIVKNIMMMCSLNLSPGTIVPVDCVDYVTACVIHSPRDGTEAMHYIMCQTQYFTLYNSYASFACLPGERGVQNGKTGPNPRKNSKTIKGYFTNRR